jgi:hypothetical protein
MVPELRPIGNAIKIFSLKKYKFSLEFLRGGCYFNSDCNNTVVKYKLRQSMNLKLIYTF